MKTKIITFVLAGMMALTIISCASSSSSSANESGGDNAVSHVAETAIFGQSAELADKYTLYLGLNDKDTFEQKNSTELQGQGERI